MKYLEFFGWGIVIYAVMRLVSEAFILYTLSSGLLPHLLSLAALFILCLIAGRSLKFASWTDIIPYSIFWAIEIGFLDAIYTVPVSINGWAMYSDWNLWLGYSLVALFPLVAPFTRTNKRSVSSQT